MSKKQIHISLEEETKQKLKVFAEDRGKSMTSIIEYALSFLFIHEPLKHEKLVTMSNILNRKFLIPEGFTIRSFWVILYLLCLKYPNASSKNFWGDIVYLSNLDKTHKEIFNEIKDELDRET